MGAWTSTQARVRCPLCAHMVGKRKSGVLRGCESSAASTQTQAVGADCLPPATGQPRRQDRYLLKGTAMQAWLGSCLACPYCRHVALQNVLPVCSTSLMPVPKSQSASEWFGCEWRSGGYLYLKTAQN